MASSDANKWYDIYKKRMLEELGINMNRQNDLSRLFVPEIDGSGMRPLFQDGFKATEEQKEELYNYAKSGQLFAISNRNNEAYQVGDDRIQSVNEVVKTENEKVSTAKRVGYSVISAIGAPIVFALNVGKRLLSIASLGILDKPLDLIGEGLSLMAGGLAERLFSVKQQKREDKNRITIGDRVAYVLSFGVERADKIKRLGHEKTLADMCVRSKADLDKKVQEAQQKARAEAEQKQKEKNISPKEKELKKTQEKIKEIQKQKNMQQEKVVADEVEAKELEKNNLKKNISKEKLDEIAEENELEENHLEENELKENNPEANPEVDNVKVNTDENVEVEAEVQNTNTQQTDNNNGDNKPNEKSGKEMKTQLAEMAEELREAFGMPNGFEEAYKIAQNMNSLINELKENPDKMIDSGMSEKDLKGLSNICNNLSSVYEKGLEAKEILLQPKKAKDLSPEERENRMVDMLLMNTFEDRMVDAALNAKANGGNMKSPAVFNTMVKNPDVYRFGMTGVIKTMPVTKSLMDKSPEDVSKYITNSWEIRKSITDNLREMSEKINTVREHEAQKQMQVQNERQGVEREQNQVQQNQAQQKELEVNQMQAR